MTIERISNCSGCGTCAQTCATDVIRMNLDKISTTTTRTDVLVGRGGMAGVFAMIWEWSRIMPPMFNVPHMRKQTEGLEDVKTYLADLSGQEALSIPGLYAAGDALGSHMCGGIYTQIGFSLVGSAVQDAIAGKAAAGYTKGKPHL